MKSLPTLGGHEKAPSESTASAAAAPSCAAECAPATFAARRVSASAVSVASECDGCPSYRSKRTPRAPRCCHPPEYGAGSGSAGASPTTHSNEPAAGRPVTAHGRSPTRTSRPAASPGGNPSPCTVSVAPPSTLDSAGVTADTCARTSSAWPRTGSAPNRSGVRAAGWSTASPSAPAVETLCGPPTSGPLATHVGPFSGPSRLPSSSYRRHTRRSGKCAPPTEPPRPSSTSAHASPVERRPLKWTSSPARTLGERTAVTFGVTAAWYVYVHALDVSRHVAGTPSTSTVTPTSTSLPAASGSGSGGVVQTSCVVVDEKVSSGHGVGPMNTLAGEYSEPKLAPRMVSDCPPAREPRVAERSVMTAPVAPPTSAHSKSAPRISIRASERAAMRGVPALRSATGDAPAPQP